MYIDKKINENLPSSLTDFLNKKYKNYNRIILNPISENDVSPLTESINYTSVPEEYLLNNIAYVVNQNGDNLNINNTITNNNIERLRTTMTNEFNNIYGVIESKNLELEIIPDDSIVQQVKCRLEFNPSGQFNYYQYFKNKLDDNKSDNNKLENVKLLNIFFDLINSPNYIVNPSDYIGYDKLDAKTIQIMKSWDNIYKSLNLTDVSNFWYSIGLYDKRYSYKTELTNQLNEFIDQMFLKWFHQSNQLDDDKYQTKFDNFFIKYNRIWSHSVASLLLPTILNQYINTLDFLPYSSEDYVRVDHYCDSNIGRLRFTDITGKYEIPNDNSVLKNNTTTLTNWLTPLTHLEFNPLDEITNYNPMYKLNGTFNFNNDYTHSKILIDAGNVWYNTTNIQLDEQFITELVDYEHKSTSSNDYLVTVEYDTNDLITKTGTITFNPYNLYNKCDDGPKINGDNYISFNGNSYYSNVTKPIYGVQYYDKEGKLHQYDNAMDYTSVIYDNTHTNSTTNEFIEPGFRTGEILNKHYNEAVAYQIDWNDNKKKPLIHRFDSVDENGNLYYKKYYAHDDKSDDQVCNDKTLLSCSYRLKRVSDDCGSFHDTQYNNIFPTPITNSYYEIIEKLYNTSVNIDNYSDSPVFANQLIITYAGEAQSYNDNSTVIYLPKQVNSLSSANDILKHLKPLKLSYNHPGVYNLYLGNGISNSTKSMLENDIRYWTQSDEPNKNYSALFSKVHAMNIFDDRYYYCLLKLYNQLSKQILRQFEADLMTLITKYPEILVVYRFKQAYYNYITTIIESNDKLYWCSVQSFLSGIVLCANDTNLIPYKFYCTKPLKLNDSDVYDINDRKLVYSIEVSSIDSNGVSNDNSVMDELYRKCQENLSIYSNTMVFPAIQIKNNVDPNEFIASISNDSLSLVAVDVRDFNNIITLDDDIKTETDELTEDTADKRTLVFALNDWYNITNVNHTQFDELFSMSLPYVLIYKEEVSNNIVCMYSTKLDNTVRVFISKNTSFSNLTLNECYTINSGNETFHQILFTGDNEYDIANIYNIIAGLTPIDDHDR